MNITPPPSTEAPPAHLESAEARLRYVETRQSAINGANWFYWIAGFSLISTLIRLVGIDLGFPLGLAATLWLDILAFAAPPIVKLALLVTGCLLMGGSIYLGWQARQERLWAFWVGMGVYGLDMLVMLVFLNNYVGVVIHLVVLFFVTRGLYAVKSLQRDFTAPA